jgi:integrase/recombinase XerC
VGIGGRAYRESPIDHMKGPKAPRPVRHTVKLDTIGKLMEFCECLRDRLAIAMLADTGLRLSELTSVRLEDVDVVARIIKVWGKGAKQRVVRYGQLTESLLTEHLKDSGFETTLLGLEAKGLSSMLARLELRTGIKCNAHSFRRIFATESVRNGMNLFHVQSLLGHSSLTMTRIYAEQVNSEDAIKAYKPIVR